MNLLIVEDNEPMRRTIKSLLGDLVAQFYECSDGCEALAAYAEHQPDWVLMDIEMEPVDGLTATKQIKAAYPNAKIIIVTNYDEPALRETAQAAGAFGYVLKENLFTLSQLLRDYANKT
jgi:two-component system response regulator DesR